MEKFLLTSVWNATIEKNDKALEPRSRVYASELGGAMIDRYLKMKAEPYTNPPNSRSMRKFMAGDIWEWIVQTVLVRAGIKYRTQERVLVEYPGLLPISGRLDFIISGGLMPEAVTIDETMPPFMQKLTEAIVNTFQGKNFEETIIEVKSVGSFVFESLLAQDNPKTHHMLQAAVYKKATNLPASVVYVCRDDVRILQYSVDTVFEDLEQMIVDDLKLITKYHNEDIEPEKESLILWDSIAEKFTKNWKVEYSPYLSKLYSRDMEGKDVPFGQPDEYSDWSTPIVSGLNRVVKRIKEGKDMTKSNEEWIEKAKQLGYPLETLNITKIATKEDASIETTS